MARLRLEEFLDKLPVPISNEELALLREQAVAMKQYSNILARRVELFNA